MDNLFVVLLNFKTKTAVTIPLKTTKIKAKKTKFGYELGITDAIDIWGNKINLEERPHKLKRYLVAYRMGDGGLGEMLDEYLRKYDKNNKKK